MCLVTQEASGYCVRPRTYGQYSSCCKGNVYNQRYYQCCGGNVYSLTSYYTGCCGGNRYNPSYHVCCPDYSMLPKRYGSDTRCCGSTVYSDKTHGCCNGEVYDVSTKSVAMDICAINTTVATPAAAGTTHTTIIHRSAAMASSVPRPTTPILNAAVPLSTTTGIPCAAMVW